MCQRRTNGRSMKASASSEPATRPAHSRIARGVLSRSICCGAGGAYSAIQPQLAGAIRDRKLEAIERSGAAVVASANPGCALHLAAAGVDVVHPLELVDRALVDRAGGGAGRAR